MTNGVLSLASGSKDEGLPILDEEKKKRSSDNRAGS